jgi:pilus assembly protein Flp/PilA
MGWGPPSCLWHLLRDGLVQLTFGMYRLTRELINPATSAQSGGFALRNFWKDESGAGATEYALILAIVGLGMGAAALALGNNTVMSVAQASNDLDAINDGPADEDSGSGGGNTGGGGGTGGGGSTGGGGTGGGGGGQGPDKPKK